MKINYLTTNTLKFKIAKNYFDGLDEHDLVQYTFEAPEIQHESCEEIARYSAVYAAQQIGEPCVKMDAGFFITALNGFPGPFVKYVNDWLSEEKILALLDGESDRRAKFIDASAIGFPDGTSEVFVREFAGTIAERGEYQPSRWPANSLFIPYGYDIPLGSMSAEEQERYWHGGIWPELIEYLNDVS